MNILVVAAHPDDEILGVGGTIVKHITNGNSVFVCIATKAYEPIWSKDYIEKKIAQQKKVDKYLGIKKRYNLDYPTVTLNTIPHGEFNKKITDIVDKVHPNIVYTHFESDVNYDHTILFRACLVATKPPKRISLYCFETLSETEWSNKPFIPNIWIDITNYIEKKIKAFSIYSSEVKTYPHPRSLKAIKILSEKRGIEACVKHAEAFILIRNISL